MNVVKDENNIIQSNVSRTNGYLCVWCMGHNKIGRKKSRASLIRTISGRTRSDTTKRNWKQEVMKYRNISVLKETELLNFFTDMTLSLAGRAQKDKIDG